MTLRRRVLGYLALAAVASCALTVGVAVVLVRHRLASQRLTSLENEADTVALAGGPPGALRAGVHVYRVDRVRSVRVRPQVAAAVSAAVPRADDSQGHVTVDGRSLIYASRQSAAGRIILIRGAQLAFAEWRSFFVSLVFAGLGGALLAALLAGLLARRLVRPIDALALATGRLAAGESSVTVPVDGEDELAGLGRSFNAMSDELTRARESQRRFLESVSHELKTPLTSVRGYAEALQDGAVTPAAAGEVIAAEADRLERLVSDLLELARVGRADFAARREPVRLDDVAATAVQRHLPRARELGVALLAGGSGARDDCTVVLGDAERVLQAVSNLVENALRMTPDGGEVRVYAEGTTITVADTGPGLDPDALPHAFERFYLHRRYRTERAVGSGLGLAVVEELVRAMDGQVEVASDEGAGSRFTIRLPKADGPTAAGGWSAAGG